MPWEELVWGEGYFNPAVARQAPSWTQGWTEVHVPRQTHYTYSLYKYSGQIFGSFVSWLTPS